MNMYYIDICSLRECVFLVGLKIYTCKYTIILYNIIEYWGKNVLLI